MLGAHREWNDKECIRTIMMSLLFCDEKELASNSRRVYADEILVKLPDGKQGFHGSIDMMTGSLTQESTILPAVIIKHKGHALKIKDPSWVEAKSVSGIPLVGRDVKKIPITDSSGDTNSSNTSEGSPGASSDDVASSDEPEAVSNESIKDINTTAQPIAELLVVRHQNQQKCST